MNALKFCINQLNRISTVDNLKKNQLIPPIVIATIASTIILTCSVKDVYAQASQASRAQSQMQETALTEAETVEHRAIVILQNGTGHIKRNHKAIELRAGTAVLALPRDIVVAQTGSITISYFDGQTSIIPPKSEIEIVFHDQHGDEQRVVLLQHVGSSINSVGKQTNDASRFEVQTSSSIASLDNAQFYVELSNTEQVRYSSNSGEAIIFMENRKPIEVEPGYEAVVQKGEEPTVAPMHNTRRTALFTTKAGNSSCAEHGVQLKQPEWDKDIINFHGTASHDDFDYYKLEYTIVGRPANKYSWLYRGDEAVVGGLLASINVADWATGEYVIRLQVVDKTGNYPDTCSINLTVE